MALHGKHASDNSGRGPSGGLWGNVPFLESLADPDKGYGIFDDFLAFNGLLTTTVGDYSSVAAYYSYQDASNTILQLATEVGGVISLDTDATDNDETWLQMGGSAGVFGKMAATVAAGKKLVFETRIRMGSITSRNIFEADRSPRASTRTWIGGAVLAIALLAAMLYAFSPGFLGDARPPIASAPPATSGLPAVVPPKPAPAPRQIVSIKSESLTLTVERPAESDTRPAAAKPAAAASTALPADSNTRTHVVVRGDTLWDIAKKHVGDPYRYPELAEFSNIRNPDLIYPGDIVRIELRDNRK